MAACKPARQCALIFPTGKRCGSPALRNQPHCYHHAADHRAYTHRFPEIDFALTYTLERLEEESTIESMFYSLPHQNQELTSTFPLNPIGPGTYK